MGKSILTMHGARPRRAGCSVRRPGPPSSIGTKGSYSPSDSPVETVMMLSFAASRLCGRARDGSLAAIMVFSLDLAGPIAEPASL